MSTAVVILKKGEGRVMKAGGAWIYDNEIDRIMGHFEDGDVVIVHDFDGYPLGRGFINMKSSIAIRMLTRNVDQEITDEFIEQRVRAAWEYRKAVIDTSSCRVIFGEADFLPGIVVDKYEDVLVVESLALGIDNFKKLICDSLVKILAEDGIVVRGIYERSDAKVRIKEGMDRIKGFISEPFDTMVQIVENGVKYTVDVENGQKTGFFLDQKGNRMAMQELVRRLTGSGRELRVLDCFTHTGSFALNCALGGATSVTGVDASELAVDRAVKNAALNGLEDRVKFVTADVLDLLPKLIEQGERYDVVILDPPAFTKSRDKIRQAMKGYREINIKGLKLVKDGGYFATCSCSHFMDYENFTKVIMQAAGAAHKRLRQVEYRTQAADHPILWSGDEASYYLKFYIFQVVDEK
ncbi:MAG: class I SAM-dependent rRNA methyltransferase [Lachnospiraceae bacterium]|nr:class I SAM-dependent rRNA methyltransferase [Lachnospiraceae bacterium]